MTVLGMAHRLPCCAGGDDEGTPKHLGSASPKQVQISLRRPFKGNSAEII